MFVRQVLFREGDITYRISDGKGKHQENRQTKNEISKHSVNAKHPGLRIYQPIVSRLHKKTQSSSSCTKSFRVKLHTVGFTFSAGSGAQSWKYIALHTAYAGRFVSMSCAINSV